MVSKEIYQLTFSDRELIRLVLLLNLDLANLPLPKERIEKILAEINQEKQLNFEKLIKRGLVSRSSGKVILDTGAAALVGVLEHATSRVFITTHKSGWTDKGKIRTLFFLDQLLIEHFSPRSNRHVFAAFQNIDALLAHLEETLRLRKRKAPKFKSPILIAENTFNQLLLHIADDSLNEFADFPKIESKNPPMIKAFMKAVSNPKSVHLISSTLEEISGKSNLNFNILDTIHGLWLIELETSGEQKEIQLRQATKAEIMTKIEDLVKTICLQKG